MAETRKYAQLPREFIDSAPDIYETPDLTEDTSTVPASTTARSPSPSTPFSEEEDASGIVRRHLQTSNARTQFADSIRERQRQRLRRPRARRRTDGTDGEVEVGGSDEEDETLDQKLARLRVEIEEAKQELAQRGSGQADGETGKAELEYNPDDVDPADGVGELSKALDAVYSQRQGQISGAEAQYDRVLGRFIHARASMQQDDGAVAKSTANGQSATVGPADRMSQEQREQALAKAAALDARLSSLEKVLGLSGSNMPDISSSGAKPILHAVSSLEKQVATASNVSDTVENVRQTVRSLTQEAERLELVRKIARESQSQDAALEKTLGMDGVLLSQQPDDPERTAKINALYGTLSTIDSISPTLPLILDRLRTLRLIHNSAGDANALLNEMEKRQGEQAEEINKWREALDKVEGALKEQEGTMTANVKSVEEWVKDIEGRVVKMG